MTPPRIARFLVVATATLVLLPVVARADGPFDFQTLTPCVVLDTQNPIGPGGGPAIQSNAIRSIPFSGTCGVPVGAGAVLITIELTSDKPGSLVLAPTITAGNLPDLPRMVPVAKKGSTLLGGVLMGLSPTGSMDVSLDTGRSAGSVQLKITVGGYFK